MNWIKFYHLLVNKFLPRRKMFIQILKHLLINNNLIESAKINNNGADKDHGNGGIKS